MINFFNGFHMCMNITVGVNVCMLIKTGAFKEQEELHSQKGQRKLSREKREHVKVHTTTTKKFEKLNANISFKKVISKFCTKKCCLSKIFFQISKYIYFRIRNRNILSLLI